MLLQILLIPFKMIFRLFGFAIMGIVKVIALPFKLLSMLVCSLSKVRGTLIILMGIIFLIGGMTGNMAIENPALVGGMTILGGAIVYAIPYVGFGFAGLLDALADLIGDMFAEVSVLPD